MTASKRVMFTPDGGEPVVGTLVELPTGGTGIWGPTDPRPTPPIYWPGFPGGGGGGGGGGQPTHPIALPGDPWWGADLKPEHPIVIPPEGETPPTSPPDSNFDCRWVYEEGQGWVLYCKGGPYDKPRPQRR